MDSYRQDVFYKKKKQSFLYTITKNNKLARQITCDLTIH